MSNLEYQPAETLTVQLYRPDPSVSWGFRLQGGVDFSTPLSIQSVSASLTQVSLKKAFPNRLIVREINRGSLAVFKGYLKFC